MSAPGGDNYKIFVKTWGQVLDDAEARMNFLHEKFESKRDNLIKGKTLNEIVEQTLNNSAAI